MPVIGYGMSALVNNQRNVRFRPGLKLKERCPYVRTSVPFVSRSVFACIAVKLLISREITLILAPASTRSGLSVVKF